jgi:predicted nucleic acid-binding protein
MTGKIALLDTNVIIDNAKSKPSMQNIVNKYSQLYISIINYVEILGFNFNEEEQKLI